MPSITLKWAANPTNDNVTAYEVWGANGTSVAFGSCAKLATVSGLTWTDTGLPANQPRTYYVVADNAVGSSAPDGPLNITSAALSTAYVQNAGGSPSVQEGTHASRPTAGTVGAIYVETDTKTIWRDNGSSWDQLAGAITGLLIFKSTTDCSANPNYPAATKGDTYVVSVAGKIGGASGTTVDAGDWYVAIADNAGGTEASVGASWGHIEHNLVGALLAANNLSDLANPSTARTNLGAAASGDAASSGITTASSKLIGRATTGTGPLEELSLSQALDLIGSATRGDILYRGASSWARLPAGTSGQFLQTQGSSADPVWATASGGGGGSSGAIVLLNRQVIGSSVAQVDFTAFDNSLYDSYIVEIEGLTCSASGEPLMRCSTDGGASYDSSSIYDNSLWYVGGSTGSGGGNTNSDGMLLGTYPSGSATSSYTARLKLANFGSTSNYKSALIDSYSLNSNGTTYRSSAGGRYRSTTAVNAVRFLIRSANITGGIFKLLGVKNS